MIDELKLICGNDIPFPEGHVTIHQPTLKEIGLIDELNFWTACEILKFNKENLVSQDKISLINKTNFHIILTMVREKTKDARQSYLAVKLLLTLLFPMSEIIIKEQTIEIKNVQTGQIGQLNNENFNSFKQILIQMFCLNEKENKQYNPSGPLAKKIAEKFKRGNQKRAQLAPEVGKIAIFSRYMSMLSIGNQLDINQIANYTVYQLLDIFNRFLLKTKYEDWVKYKIAGATGLENEPPDWSKDLHDNKNNY